MLRLGGPVRCWLLALLLACSPPAGPGERPAADPSGGDDGGSGGEGSGGTDDTGGSGGDAGGTDGETDDGGDDTGDGDDTGGGPGWEVDAVVVAGDSWSTGSVPLTAALFEAQGLEGIVLSYETTAIAGSRAEEWADNEDGKLDALRAALDGSAHGRPQADLLLLYLGGNDYNAALAAGLSPWKSRDQALEELMDDIEEDLGVLLDAVLDAEPELHVVIVGYDYLHLEWWTTLYGIDLDADGFLEYNEGLALLEARKLSLARERERVHYAHNLGIWTHVLGNPVSPPWSSPLVDVPAGFFDAPSTAPDYAPFPGGCRRSDLDPEDFPPESLPGPVAAFIDGIHPSDTGWSVLLQHTWDQGLGSLARTGTWSP